MTTHNAPTLEIQNVNQIITELVALSTRVHNIGPTFDRLQAQCRIKEAIGGLKLDLERLKDPCSYSRCTGLGSGPQGD